MSALPSLPWSTKYLNLAEDLIERLLLSWILKDELKFFKRRRKQEGERLRVVKEHSFPRNGE